MVLTRDGWWRGSQGLSARRARRTKSSRPEGPYAGPKGRQLEVGVRRAPRLLVVFIYLSHMSYTISNVHALICVVTNLVTSAKDAASQLKLIKSSPSSKNV